MYWFQVIFIEKPSFLSGEIFSECSTCFRNHYLCTVHASRLMVPRKKGLIVNVSSAGGLRYLFNIPYGVGKEAVYFKLFLTSIWLFVLSFIHIKHLYSAPSRKLLRGAQITKLTHTCRSLGNKTFWSIFGHSVLKFSFCCIILIIL